MRLLYVQFQLWNQEQCVRLVGGLFSEVVSMACIHWYRDKLQPSSYWSWELAMPFPPML